jgi:hypothetical protein
MDTRGEVRFDRQFRDGQKKGDFVDANWLAQGCSKKRVFGENRGSKQGSLLIRKSNNGSQGWTMVVQNVPCYSGTFF